MNTKIKVHQVIVRIIILCSAMSILALTWNLYHVYTINKDGEENFILQDASNENSVYKIGHNPTALNKKYFAELSEAVKKNDLPGISSSLVKTFISEYFNWTNKDGNYDVGGMNYIYTDMQKNFYQFSIDGFYRDFDAAISKYGHKELLEVEDVVIDEVKEISPLSLEIEKDDDKKTTVTFNAYQVHAKWTYKNHQMDSSEVMHAAEFIIVDHQKRWEISSVESK